MFLASTILGGAVATVPRIEEQAVLTTVIVAATVTVVTLLLLLLLLLLHLSFTGPQGPREKETKGSFLAHLSG